MAVRATSAPAATEIAVRIFSAPATTLTPRARATTAGDPGPPEAAASHVTGASVAARYCLIDSRGGGSSRWLISSHAYVTAATDATAAAPEAHAGAFAPQASATMPARASSHAVTAVTLSQIRVFTWEEFWREATRSLRVLCAMRRRQHRIRCRC